MSKILIAQNSVQTLLRFRKDYIKFLMLQGHQVVALAPLDSIGAQKDLEALGVEVKYVPYAAGYIGRIFGYFLMNLHILAFLLFNRKGKLVIHFAVTFFLCCLPVYILRRRTVVFVEGLGSLFSNSFFRRLLKFLLDVEFITLVCCNSDEIQAVGNKRTLLLGGIGVPIPEVAGAVPKKFKLLFVGRLIRDKGISDLIDAFRIFSKNDSSAELDILGSPYFGNPTSITDREIENIKSEFNNRITFHGTVEFPEDYYKEASLLVLPSKREGFPVCVMEASSFGVPSVCYRVPGCSDAILEGSNGFLVEYGDIKALVAAFVHVSTMGEESYNALRIACRAHAIKNFDIDKKTRFIADIIERPTFQAAPADEIEVPI